MKSVIDNQKIIHVRGLVSLITLVVALMVQWPMEVAAAESLLSGRVTSTSGQALAGIPVRATRGTITVSVYTNTRGEYTYPDWSELKVGAYSVSVELPEFEHVTQSTVLSAGKTAKLDITLTARTPSVEDVTASDIIAALPGTNEQKHLLIQCDNCHSLQHAFRVPRDKEGWTQIIRKMAGEARIDNETPNTRAYGQKQYLEPLAEYLTMIRGPGSSSDIPFKLRPRPTSDASTSLVVTEYDIPRGGGREHILRGDKRAAWPHDILLDEEGTYAYYTDHYSYNLGRLNRRTGEVKEFPYEVLEGMGRVGGMVAAAQARAGNPGGGAHDILWDDEGNVVFGMGGGTIVFNPETEKFTPYASGSNMFGMDGEGNVWYLDDVLHKLDIKTGAITDIDIPKNVDGVTYDMDTNDQGQSFMNMFRESSIGMYNPATEQFEAIPTPTHGAGPRRGDIDDQGRPWMGLYWAGLVGMLDPVTKKMKEYSLIPNYKPYAPPFISTYSVAVDDKNQIVWTNDFNSRRTYKIDIQTEESTEYYMPLPYEVRDITVEDNTDRPTVWIPAYRPPSRMVKIELF
jgi:virginiamycin B lyase